MNSLFLLLRSALWGMPVNPERLGAPADIDNTMHLAGMQCVAGLAASVIVDNAVAIGLERDKVRELHSAMLTVQRGNLRVNGVLAEVATILKRAGIAAVLLKGQGVASNYPVPTLRQCGDIDIYVGKESFRRACDILCEAGADDDGKVSVKHWNTEFHGVHVEIHRIAETLYSPIANRIFQQWSVEQLTGNELQRLDVDGVTVNMPPITFNTFYIFNHAWHHFISGGVGLRQLCDLAIHLHTYKSQIDRNELRNRLCRFGLLKSWRVFGCIIVDYLGLPPDEYPFYDPSCRQLAAKSLAMIMRDGNFGFYSPLRGKRPKGYLAGKLYSLRISTLRQLVMVRISPRNSVQYYLRYLYTGVKTVINDKI